MKHVGLLTWIILWVTAAFALNPVEDSEEDRQKHAYEELDQIARSAKPYQLRDTPRDVYSNRNVIDSDKLWREAARVEATFNNVTPEEKEKAFDLHYGINQEISKHDISHNRVKATRIKNKKKSVATQPRKEAAREYRAPRVLNTKQIKVYDQKYFDDKLFGKTVNGLKDESEMRGQKEFNERDAHAAVENSGIHPKSARAKHPHKVQVADYLAHIEDLGDSEEYGGLKRPEKSEDIDQSNLDFGLDVIEKEKQKNKQPKKGTPPRRYLPDNTNNGQMLRTGVHLYLALLFVVCALL
ncbi:hypothetical protein BABINDRAFT_168692 [Babjeviella inositovora NRRL Y-12698]|uniref:Uncharacterized protein n=1 Tax=Babjeviella inositovora NRRL Y-12698 TaxID=984486 RepID=A0A1E3QK88_9ASCO|nr:uncharacterized protein BABINDRAFT_168692 [Babjeviella inositovora NRRL Y-12698]ODQ78116.1 hypothetical protein BABINDRAFT_168692 [Babjeviella inositovora NRRL Y-12698]